MNLLSRINVINVSARSSASTAVSDAVDMQGYEGCVFIANGSTLMEGSSNVTLKIKSSTASAGTYTLYSGNVASTAIATGSKNYRVLMADVYKPEERYLKAVVAGASSDVSYLNNILAIQYGARRPGSSALNNSTTIAGSTIMVSPSTS